MKYLSYLFYCFALCCTLFTASHFDHTLTDWKMELYHNWYIEAQESTIKLADNKPYCIIAQGTWQSRIHFDSFEQVNIRPIIYRQVQDQIYQYTWFLGAEMLQKNHHVGVVIDGIFHRWQFENQQFVVSREINIPCKNDDKGDIK